MLKNPRLLGLLIILLVFVLFRLKTPQSQVNLISGQNKFKLNFTLQKNDQAAADQLLEKLSLPQSLKQGVEFQIDSTSSAKLSYASPIRADITFAKDTLNFQGQLTRSIPDSELSFENIKIPENASIAIGAGDFRKFLQKFTNPPQEFITWMDKNLTSDMGQYLVVFGQNNDYAYIVKNASVDFSQLKNLKDQTGRSLYKEETVEGTNFILLKFEDEKLISIFTQDGTNYIVSSPQGAKDFHESIKSPQSISFPNLPQKQKAAVVISFVNKSQDTSAFDYFFATPDKFAKTLEKIKKFSFVLKKNSFSGSFSVQ